MNENRQIDGIVGSVCAQMYAQWKHVSVTKCVCVCNDEGETYKKSRLTNFVEHMFDTTDEFDAYMFVFVRCCIFIHVLCTLIPVHANCRL